MLTLTEVHLQQRNYRVIRLNVNCTSRGFALLGLLMLKPPDAAEAFAGLYEEGNLRVLIAERRALAFVNVMQASSAPGISCCFLCLKSPSGWTWWNLLSRDPYTES